MSERQQAARDTIAQISKILGSEEGSTLSPEDMILRACTSEQDMNLLAELLDPFCSHIKIAPYYPVGFGSIHSDTYRKVLELAGETVN